MTQPTDDFLTQLALIRDNLALYADDVAGLWTVIYSLDLVLQRYGQRQ